MAASPQLLIIDSVLMSALLGRRAPGTAVILTVPPIVKPPLPPLLVASLVQREPGPDCHRAMGGRGWLGDILGPVVIARDLRWAAEQASSALLGITTTANLEQPGNQVDLEQGCQWSRNIIRARETQM